MTPEQIRDISVTVYKLRLEDGNPGAVERMLADDRKKDPKDDGGKLRNRAAAFDPVTRAYLKVFSACETQGDKT